MSIVYKLSSKLLMRDMPAFEQEKIATYLKLIDLYSRFLSEKNAADKLKKSDVNFFTKLIVEIGVKLFVFGSDEVVKKYLALRRHSIVTAKDESSEDTIKYVSDLLLAMRKELVSLNTEIGAQEFLKMISNDWQTVESLGKV